MTTAIKTLAIQYYTETDKALKVGILLKAEKLLQSIEFKSMAQIKRDLGISYFAGVNSSSKIIKGTKENFDTLVLYLSASSNAGKDVCSFASVGCRLACLVGSGHALIEKRSKRNSIHVSRIVKTWLTVFRKDLANDMLLKEIQAASRKAVKAGNKFACRLNGTSDLEFQDTYESFPNVQFYDYTKNPNRKSLSNYHVTFSYSTKGKARIGHYKTAIAKGQTVAFPVIASDYQKALELPNAFDMDKTDLRFLDDAGKYGILKAKQTVNSDKGEKESFLLSLSELKEVIALIEA